MKYKSILNRVDASIIIVFMIAVPLYIFMELKMNMAEQNVEYCFNDAYSYEHETGIYLILPLSQLIIINKMKYELRMGVLVRIGNMKFMWLRICKKITRIAAALTAYIFVWTTVYAVLNCNLVCNWTQDNSNAYFILQRHVDRNVNVLFVGGIFLLLVFTEIVVTAMIILIIWWWLKQPLYGYVFMIVLLLLEKRIYPPVIQLFFSRMNLECTEFYYRGANFKNQFVFPLICILGVFFLGFAIFRRKDLLQKEVNL